MPLQFACKRCCISILFILLLMACEGPQPARREPDPLADTYTGMRFALVTGGCYTMGDRIGRGDPNERPAHMVCVNTFYIGVTEVTQDQWRRVMGVIPSVFQDCGSNCPVESVSWNEAQEFLARISRRNGRSYRLPTEAEWEFAARNRGRGDRYAGTNEPARLGDYAWFGGNANRTVHPVARKQGNALGLFDMSGNVWEWCADRYDDRFYARSPITDPQGPETGNTRVVRGGAWTSSLEHTVTARRWFEPDFESDFIGLRVAYSP